MEHTTGDRLKTALALALGGLVAGLVLAFAMGRPELASTVWIVGVVPVLAALMIEIGRDESACKHVAALSIEANAKPPGTLPERGFTALEDVTDRLADCRIFEPARHIADGRQAA